MLILNICFLQSASVKKTATGRKSDASQSPHRVSSNRRQSIKESEFAVQYRDLLKPIYPYYQAFHFAIYGADFQWESSNRKCCVQILLDAARQCHNESNYTTLRKAVHAELIGEQDNPRYIPLHMLG